MSHNEYWPYGGYNGQFLFNWFDKALIQLYNGPSNNQCEYPLKMQKVLPSFLPSYLPPYQHFPGAKCASMEVWHASNVVKMYIEISMDSTSSAVCPAHLNAYRHCVDAHRRNSVHIGALKYVLVVKTQQGNASSLPLFSRVLTWPDVDLNAPHADHT